MVQQKFSSLFVVWLAITATWLFAALVWSAPEPKDKPASAEEENAEPAKANEEEVAQNLKKSQKNLRKIALAFYNCGLTTSLMPRDLGEDNSGKEGKPHLSWRVLLLPYLEEDVLYKKFKWNEPWDSEHNKKLMENMPDVYSSPRVVVKKKGYTVYQGFAGEGALFEPGKKLKFPASITDDKSKTIMIVESSVAVPWTKPADLPFDVKKELPDFGKAYRGKPLAALCNNSIRILDLKTLTPKTLKAAITIAGGETLGPDW